MNCIIKELDTLEDNWGNIEYIIPYGCGLEAYRTLNRIIKDFNVPYIIDNDPKKWGKTFYGIQIKSPEILKEKKNNEKVLVTIARRRYGEIKKFLEKYNLKENIDFSEIRVNGASCDFEANLDYFNLTDTKADQISFIRRRYEFFEQAVGLRDFRLEIFGDIHQDTQIGMILNGISRYREESSP